MTQRISLIWAMTRNRVIGNAGGLPWRLPDEMAHFKRTTLGHAVIMGRRTYESVGHPLPERHNIVLSRRGFTTADPRVTVAADFDAALAAAGEGECFVIGGAQPYATALPRAHRLIGTFIDAEIDGDTCFPEFDPDAWRVVECTHHSVDERHAYGYDIKVFVPRRSSTR